MRERELSVVVSGDAEALTELLPGLQLLDEVEVIISWPGGGASLRQTLRAVEGEDGEPRQLRVTFRGNVSRRTVATPPYGVPAAVRRDPSRPSAPPRRAT